MDGMTDINGAIRKGDWMLTAKGIQFWPLDPKAEEVDIFDIAAGLAQQGRYNGQTLYYFSVAEHSCLLARYFLDRNDRDLARWALLHDAAEAYLGDIIRPLKPFLPEFLAAEQRVERVIWDRFGLHGGLPCEVKDADTRILTDEMCRLFSNEAVERHGLNRRRRLGVKIDCLSPCMADGLFRRMFRELFGPGCGE